DFGETFNPLHTGLPWGSTRCLREDLVNPSLLYLGTEFSLWVSIDRGQNWTPFNQSLPTVAIHDVAIHPENGEIVVATHGRSLWACDVTGLRQLKSENIGKEIAFFDPLDVTRWRNDSGRGGTNRSFVGQNPSQGAKLWYALPKKSEKVLLRIENIDGELISELNAKVEPGLHLLTWDLTQTNRDAARGPGGGTGGGGGTRPSGRAPRERTERSGDEATDRPNPNPSTPNPPAQEEADAEGQQTTPPSPADASATQNPGAQPSGTQPSGTSLLERKTQVQPRPQRAIERRADSSVSAAHGLSPTASTACS
ncbi:MAG: hypothetical protein ACOYOZ_10670, partial [Pirellula sp.]